VENTKAFLKSSSSKSFPFWCQCYKDFFASLLTKRPNKLECLYLAITFQSSLTFAGSTRSLPRRKHLKGPPIGFALALPSNFKTRLERISKGKPSSLLGLIVSDEGKKSFITLTPGANVKKLCSLSLMLEQSKLSSLTLASFFSGQANICHQGRCSTHWVSSRLY